MQQRSCPHCQHDLTLKEAVVILNGSGYTQAAKVRLKNGAICIVADASRINPNEVEILEPQ